MTMNKIVIILVMVVIMVLVSDGDDKSQIVLVIASGNNCAIDNKTLRRYNSKMHQFFSL